MPNVYQPKLLQIRPQFTPNQETGTVPQNILWFTSAATTIPSLANLTAIGAAFDAAWGTYWSNWGGSDTFYTGSITTDWSSNTGLIYDSVGAYTPKAGTKGEAMSGNVAVLVSYSIPLRWRGGHFRTYLPYPGSSIQDSANPNKVAAGSVTAITSALQAFNTAMAASGVLGGQTQVAYKHKGTAATAEIFNIASFIVQPYFASQRRRLRKVTRK